MKVLRQFGISQQVPFPKETVLFLSSLLANPPKNTLELERRKYHFSAQKGIPILQNRDLIAMAQKEGIDLPSSLLSLLQKRAVRTISGVTPIGILTKPYPCPGKCIYCPTEVRMPKSYLSSQPAAARAVRNRFHPFKQVQSRMQALQDSGHPLSKLEIIVMGGTWSFLPARYRSWYIKRCFDAANTFGAKEKEVAAYKKGVRTLKAAQHYNATARHRIIGLTLETRPDYITEKELYSMRRYGCTRIEIGVQTLDDEVQRLTKRGHTRAQVIRAMRLMKDYGFKVCFHLMPGLPGSSPEKDLVWMREVFENPDFRPDFVKIYPCVVLDNTELKHWWEQGKYKPYSDKEIIRLLVQWQYFVPEWVRIMRLMRDIPVSHILDGARYSNLRQILQYQPEKLKEIVGEDFFRRYALDKNHYRFRDIRAREIGFADIQRHPDILRRPLKLVRREYEASNGKEVFLSFEDESETYLFALLRLRKPSENFSPRYFSSVLKGAALIREVHSYGSEVSVGAGMGIGQHRGLGKRLIAEAERIAREEWGLKRITVIAGVGTREYYQKWGYKLRATYMTKVL